MVEEVLTNYISVWSTNYVFKFFQPQIKMGSLPAEVLAK